MNERLNEYCKRRRKVKSYISVYLISGEEELIAVIAKLCHQMSVCRYFYIDANEENDQLHIAIDKQIVLKKAREYFLPVVILLTSYFIFNLAYTKKYLTAMQFLAYFGYDQKNNWP